MAKILIWDLNMTLYNSGGPSGYLYNIYSYLKKNPSAHISFLSDIIKAQNSDDGHQSTFKINKKALNTIKKSPYIGKIYDKLIKYWCFSVHFWNFKYKKDNLTIEIINKISQFDVIHFHSAINIRRARRIIHTYKGIKVLTSHSPQPLSNELLDELHPNKFLRKALSKILYKLEIDGWKRCNYLMFPVKTSMEPYQKINLFFNYIESHPSKFIFCPSSLNPNYNFKGISIREKLKIPKDTFIISYIGRHNHVKGYDELKQFGRIVLKEYNNVYFIIAGKEAPLEGLKHERWIELGWIDYSNDLLKEADLFILPNYETYFDLITLEVLRIGTPLLMSRTGGNKFFETFSKSETAGMELYNYGDLDSQMHGFKKIYNNILNGNKNTFIKSNQNLFNKYFTTNTFISNYLYLMSNLIKQSSF